MGCSASAAVGGAVPSSASSASSPSFFLACREHAGQRVTLLCRVDGRLACDACRRSRAHAGHALLGLPAAAPYLASALRQRREDLVRLAPAVAAWAGKVSEFAAHSGDRLATAVPATQAAVLELSSYMSECAACVVGALPRGWTKAQEAALDAVVVNSEQLGCLARVGAAALQDANPLHIALALEALGTGSRLLPYTPMSLPPRWDVVCDAPALTTALHTHLRDTHLHVQPRLARLSSPSFVCGPRGHVNTLTLSMPGRGTRDVLPGDVDLQLRTPTGTPVVGSMVSCSVVAPGRVEVGYTLADPALQRLHVAVAVGGLPVGGGLLLSRGYHASGQHVRRVVLRTPTPHGMNLGLAVRQPLSPGDEPLLYVTHSSSVVSYDPHSGAAVGKYGGVGLLAPHMCAVSQADTLLVTDSARGGVVELSFSGLQFLRRFGESVREPRGIACGEGVVALTSPRAPCVHVFSYDTGDPLRAFGEKGPGPQQLTRPGGVRLCGNGDLLVCDMDQRLQCYSAAGTHVYTHTYAHTLMPVDVETAATGRVVVASARGACALVSHAAGPSLASAADTRMAPPGPLVRYAALAVVCDALYCLAAAEAWVDVFL